MPNGRLEAVMLESRASTGRYFIPRPYDTTIRSMVSPVYHVARR